MTTPPQPPMQGAPLVDQGNSLLAPVPARMDTGTIDMMGQQMGVLTIRTTSATITVMLGASDLRAWSEILVKLADKMAGAGLVQATPVDIAALAQQLEQTPARRRR